MAVVLEAVPFGAAGRQRQDRVEAIERLNGRLLVDAEHRRMLRRLHIQTEHGGGLVSKSGSVDRI